MDYQKIKEFIVISITLLLAMFAIPVIIMELIGYIYGLIIAVLLSLIITSSIINTFYVILNLNENKAL